MKHLLKGKGDANFCNSYEMVSQTYRFSPEIKMNCRYILEIIFCQNYKITRMNFKIT